MLIDGGEEKVVEMAAAGCCIADESDDAVLAVRGGMGSYTSDPDQLRKNKKNSLTSALNVSKSFG